MLIVMLIVIQIILLVILNVEEKGKKYNSKWNREYTERALQDLKELNEREFTKKYDLKSHQKYLHMRWYAKVRAKQLNINVG